jgi:hypothetical protein
MAKVQQSADATESNMQVQSLHFNEFVQAYVKLESDKEEADATIEELGLKVCVYIFNLYAACLYLNMSFHS